MAERILVFSLKLLGDLIVQTPAFAALRRRFPNANIVVLCDKKYCEALATNPDINEVWGVPLADVKKKPALVKPFLRLALFLRWGWRIRRSRFSRVLLMDCNDRACVWARLSGAPLRAGLAQQKLSFLLNRLMTDTEGSADYIDFYLRLSYLVGANATDRRTYFPVPADLRAPIVADYVALHPGASLAEKRWPASRWAQLIAALATEHAQLSFLLIGGPGEASLCEEISAALPHSVPKERVVVMAARPLTETAAALKAANLVFCLDSAARHLAAAVGTPTISLVARWILPTWGLYDEAQGHYVLAADVPRDHYSVDSIQVAEVLSIYRRAVLAGFIDRKTKAT